MAAQREQQLPAVSVPVLQRAVLARCKYIVRAWDKCHLHTEDVLDICTNPRHSRERAFWLLLENKMKHMSLNVVHSR